MTDDFRTDANPELDPIEDEPLDPPADEDDGDEDEPEEGKNQ